MILSGGPAPFDFLSGSLEKVPCKLSNLAYQFFYKSVLKGNDLSDIISDMKVHFEGLKFISFTSEQLFSIAWEAIEKTELANKNLGEIKKLKEQFYDRFNAK